MKATKEFKEGLELLRETVKHHDDLQITVMGMEGNFQIHWRTICLDLETTEDVVKAINALDVLEQLGAHDF